MRQLILILALLGSSVSYADFTSCAETFARDNDKVTVLYVKHFKIGSNVERTFTIFKDTYRCLGTPLTDGVSVMCTNIKTSEGFASKQGSPDEGGLYYASITILTHSKSVYWGFACK